MFCRNCGKEMTDGAAFCVSCGAANNPVNCEANNPVNYAANQMPMKWYNFLIYFALFAGAVLNVLTGIFMLTGAQYNMQGGS